jgi:signal transduction histidine kinase
LSKPIRDMEAATQRIAAGDLDVRLGDYPAHEIGRLAASINHMAERLKHLEDERARFISEIAHDLRTPLAAIKGLLVNLIDAAAPDERPSLEIAEHETDRLIRLVNQLLDFSRWQTGRLELNRRPVDVGSLAHDAVTLSESQACHQGVALTAEIHPNLPMVSADPDRLEQVILNLLDNAIKFTPKGGQVTLTATKLGDGTWPAPAVPIPPRPGSPVRGPGETGTGSGTPDGPGSLSEDEIQVSVRDTGRGMHEEEQARAFEAYYSGPGGGSGLGLTIARAIVETHGGRMGIESNPGQGSRVWLTLPL